MLSAHSMKKTIISSVSLFVGLAILSGCTISNEARDKLEGQCLPGVVGGSVTAKSDPLSKQVVMLIGSRYNEKGEEESSVCTGTPITEDVILTAAHCVKGNVRMAAIFANDMNCSSGFRASRDSIVASSFEYDHSFVESYSGFYNDVGLVRLKSKIPSDYEISELYAGAELSSDDVTLVGFGKTSETKSDSMILRSKTKSFKNDITVSSDRVTIEQSEGGLCQGDSGGPIFVEVNGEKQVIGVTSYVSNRYESNICHGKAVGMLSKSVLPWIEKTLPTLK